MEKGYLLETEEINKRFKKYRKDIDYIFEFSQNVSKDLVKYVLQVLKDDDNPEIGKIIVDVAFEKHATMLTILKAIVKILYVVKNITKYKYGEYFRLKQFIDEALDNNESDKAEIAKKKYMLLLEKIEKENGVVPQKTVLKEKAKKEQVAKITDQINRQYIRFV